MIQAGPGSSPQDFPFELGEDRQQSGHGATRLRGYVQRLGQRNESNTQMFQFLKGGQQIGHGAAPAVQPAPARRPGARVLSKKFSVNSLVQTTQLTGIL